MAKSWTCKYLKFTKEVGEVEHTPHLQGWISFASAKTWDAMKKWAPEKLSFRAIKGSLLQNEEYVSKTQNQADFWVFEKGEMPEEPAAQGIAEKRRWADAFDAVKEGRLQDVPKDILCTRLKNIQYAVLQVVMSQMKVETLQGEFRHQWWYGPPGTGKSRRAHEEYPDAYIKSATTKWWDGYVGQDVVIIDDFNKFQVKLTTEMKNWTDRYPFQAETKGGTILIRPGMIITTSNQHPDEIWDDSDANCVAMKRRHQVVHFPITPFQGTSARGPGSGASRQDVANPTDPPLGSAYSGNPTDPPTPLRVQGRVSADSLFTAEEMDSQLNINIGL